MLITTLHVAQAPCSSLLLSYLIWKTPVSLNPTPSILFGILAASVIGSLITNQSHYEFTQTTKSSPIYHA